VSGSPRADRRDCPRRAWLPGRDKLGSRRIFAANVPAPPSDPAAVAAALDSALAKVMREIVIWTAPKI
jgi:ABC-type uncharacterized transport system auxiliary subunit